MTSVIPAAEDRRTGIRIRLRTRRASRLVAALALAAAALLSATPGHALINCDDPAVVGPVTLQVNAGIPANTRMNPVINRRHIFCGEINSAGRAVGFHYRQEGFDPQRGGIVGSPPQAQITGGATDIITPAQPAKNRRYIGRGVQVWDATTSAFITKANPSTFYPSNCSPDQVINSIRYAYTHATRTPSAEGGAFEGPSGPLPATVNYCYGVEPVGGIQVAPFFIRGFLNNMPARGGWVINTAFPVSTF